ncbi:reverse transcriptase family protein [Roseomonas mucosa]|uniref:reverse transcriptase family protein n=1 Tax=Roseomonas mucosa TaxID=207340 RepID=UPI0028CCA4F3|nr:reverse transcriptase family protein [Roseomonas sp. DSM 102946]
MLYNVGSISRLAAILGLPKENLEKIANGTDNYSTRSIEINKNGKIKQRIIQEPKGQLRPIHVSIRRLLSRISPPNFLYCPVKRRSYVGNAMQHILAKEIRTLDLKSYFPSTPRHRVFWFFNKIMKCSSDVSAVLAKLLTVENHLATGSTVSPILSFFAFYDMWNEISKLVREAGCVLTVYIDDITISGTSVPGKLVWMVKKEIHKRGLIYHKERYFANGIGEITGVIIKDGSASVPNRQLRKAYDIRARVCAAVEEDEARRLKAQLLGLKQQRKQVEGKR